MTRLAGRLPLVLLSSCRRRWAGTADLPEAKGVIDTLVKVGGGALRDRALLDKVATAIGALALDAPVLVVPGGGPFADAVREVDRRFGLSADEAHWMAIGAMDQSARLVVPRLATGELVRSAEAASAALLHGRVPVLAPLAWLQEADPLRHSWEATSDSVAAWVAGQVGARRLVLVKPSGADLERPDSLVDPCFGNYLPVGLEWSVVTADQPELVSASIVRTGRQRSPSARTRLVSI